MDKAKTAERDWSEEGSRHSANAVSFSLPFSAVLQVTLHIAYGRLRLRIIGSRTDHLAVGGVGVGVGVGE